MLKSKAFDTSLAELVYVLSVVMNDITTQFVGVVYLWSAWLFDYRLREETRWMIMRRPDHCWSTMSRQTRTDQSRTPIWSKCHHATPCASKNMVYITQKNYGTITAFLLVVWSHVIGTENVIHSVICLKSTKNHYICQQKESTTMTLHTMFLYSWKTCLTRMVTLPIADLSVTTFARQ